MNLENYPKDKFVLQNESANYQSDARTFDLIYNYIVDLLRPTSTIIPPCVLIPCNRPIRPPCVSYSCGPPLRPPMIPPPVPIPPRYPCCPQCGQLCYRPYPYYPSMGTGGVYNPYWNYLLFPGIGNNIQTVGGTIQNVGGNIQNIGSAVQNTGDYIYGQGVNTIQGVPPYILG